MTVKIEGRTRYYGKAKATIIIEDQHRIETLFKIKGGSLSERTDLGTFLIECQHPTDTDVEHDAAKVAYFEGAGLKFVGILGKEVYLTGVLLTAAYYTEEPNTDGEKCDTEWCKEDHGFMEFIPPKQKFTPQLCYITVRFK